ncbi:hypothetical protein [Candidatus Palauibacter soopunensis]|uniref:hypothetical protein n=1 Tax=Candidatus Palauibacter soopunensis TaxID=3056739 RepID=UPI00238E1ECF|nr:hypothetical protein [Candidatus Palauibacter soopunensis]MDE2879277.1 hypothetical protein [Candidatus Palauibacter soopunensis]
MIRVFADTPRDADRIRRAVDGDVQVVENAEELAADPGCDHSRLDCDHGHLEYDRGRLDCVVVGCHTRFLRERIGLLARLEREMPWVPVILVTDRDADAAKLLASTRCSALVWFDDPAARLRSRIEAACETTALVQLADRIRRSALPPALRRALVHSLRQAGSDPVHSVGALATAMGSSPVTLSHEFTARVNGGATLCRFLSALVILRAHQLRLSGSSWTNAGGRLGFARRTLNRKAHTWPGHSLADLERIAPDRLLSAFVEEYVRPLLGRDVL